MLEWNILYTLQLAILHPPFLVNGIKIPPSGEFRDGGESAIAPPPPQTRKTKIVFFFLINSHNKTNLSSKHIC